MSTNQDEIRTNILKYLYDVHHNARSAKKASVLISELQRSLKTRYSYKQQEVASNLDYLVQIEWVVKVVETRAVPLKSGMTVDQSRVTYKVSAKGIDRVEGASLYRPPSAAGSLNITNVAGVVVTGSGNVVNTTFSEAAKAASELRKKIVEDDTLPDEQKLSILSDIDSLSMQLQKPQPNKQVLRMLWDSVKVGATISGASDLILHLGHALASVISK